MVGRGGGEEEGKGEGASFRGCGKESKRGGDGVREGRSGEKGERIWINLV